MGHRCPAFIGSLIITILENHLNFIIFYGHPTIPSLSLVAI